MAMYDDTTRSEILFDIQKKTDKKTEAELQYKVLQKNLPLWIF